MPDRPPASRLQILEKGGRLVVIDRETGLPPLSAAERMRQYDAQSGNGPARFASLDSAEAGSAPQGKAASTTPNPFANTASHAAKTRPTKAMTKAAPTQSGSSTVQRPSTAAGKAALLPFNQQETIALLITIAAAMIFLTLIMGLDSIIFIFAAIAFSLFQGWPQQIARKLVRLSEQQKRP